MAVDLGRFERQLREQGFRRVAGVDEAGRGAWAGPMLAAAVILPETFELDGLDDSKVLSRAQRDEAFERVTRDATAVAVCRATAARIDNRGLHRCNVAILQEAVARLEPGPDFVLCDGWPVEMDVPHLSIKKGDAVAAAVAAASIVAKVTRDRIMERYAKRFPGYGFEQHKGYGTAEHREAIDRLGTTPIHRLSFGGVGQPELPGLTAPA
jgi:ribonuclease HII